MTISSPKGDKTSLTLGVVERWIATTFASAIVALGGLMYLDVRGLRQDVTEVKAKMPDSLAERLATVEARK